VQRTTTRPRTPPRERRTLSGRAIERGRAHGHPSIGARARSSSSSPP
jgi:hypothetical protein